MQLNPYFHFNGDCEVAFKFYEQVLGGKIESLISHEGMPGASQLPAEWRSKIMHARMIIGEQAIMGMDAPPERYQKPQGFHASISLAEPAEAERIFHALAEGGIQTMPIQETFWSVRFGMLVDRFGIPWMINCEQAAEKAA